MDTFISPHEMLLRLVLALVAGGVVGIERELNRKPAGLRTHMMVALGSATFVLLAMSLYTTVVNESDPSTRVDPIRLLEGIMGGIGFLGAGAIIRDRASVEGLTTAGSIWLTGALGAAAGLGYYVLGGLAVVMALVVLSLLGLVERRLFAGSRDRLSEREDQDSD